MPNPVLADVLPPETLALHARAAANARLAERVFGRAVRETRPGWFEAEYPELPEHHRWSLVEDYGGADHAAGALRRRLCELGYDVGVFAEGGPQWAPPLGGRVVCIVRSCGVPVARGEAAGPHAEAAATAAAAHALVDSPGWRP